MKEIVSVLNLIGLGGVGFFIYYLFKGLNQRINTLTEITKEQDKVLAVVRERAGEMQEWRKDYRTLFDEFQEIGAKLDARKNRLIKELEDANQQKDISLSELTAEKLKEIELRKQSYEKIQLLEYELKKNNIEFEQQWKILFSEKKI